MTRVKQLNYLPVSLLTAMPESLHKLFPDPTLFHLSGKHKEPLFVSVLLHGNETTGFLGLQKLLLKYQKQELPRSLSFYLGNTLAANQGVRRLDKQPDFNRIWPGTELPETNETLMAQEIVDIMEQRNIFASIDVHNNTGLNPQYACVNKLDNQFLQLANLFGRLVVYFTRPIGVQSGAFSKLCPSVTLECGKPGHQFGVDHTFEYLNSCLHLSKLSDQPVLSQDIDIYHTVAQVKINKGIQFSFDVQTELVLDKDLERMNFTEISAGTEFGIVNHNVSMPLIVKNSEGNIVTEKFFTMTENRLTIKKNTMPSMLTLDERVIRQDCLCYLMEKVDLSLFITSP
ncbi:MAG: succinylglutamate desuccinylase/aspartoacylase family protein [Methylococcales bacterium]|nr:succinylglutamate desuccinylase/aspartoacylase family protein [Methylococcales bacterium]